MPSRVILAVSATTAVGKTEVVVNIGALGGRLGIPSMIADLSTVPRANAGLRLGFPLSDQPGREMVLQDEWGSDLYLRLKLRYGDRQLYTIRPISAPVVGCLRDAAPGGVERLIDYARLQYPLTVSDTTPILDDESVVASLDTADKALYVVDATDDRVEQRAARLPWVQQAKPEPDRLMVAIDKAGRGGWSPQDVLDRMGIPDHRAIVLPDENARHRAAIMSHRPIALDPRRDDPWSRLFTAVAGHLLPPDARKRWSERPAPSARPEPAVARETVSHRRGVAKVIDWLRSSSGRIQA